MVRVALILRDCMRRVLVTFDRSQKGAFERCFRRDELERANSEAGAAFSP